MNLRGEIRTWGGLKRMLYAWAVVGLPIPSIGATPFDALIACTQLTEDAARLACFDREMAEIRRDNSPPPKVLHAHLVSVSGTALARQVFVLDNAQTWQQIELNPDFAARIGQEVTISKGALGSFWLATDSHHATRVKRIR